MAANGMQFAADIECATAVRMATILVLIQPTRLGYSETVIGLESADVMLLWQRR